MNPPWNAMEKKEISELIEKAKSDNQLAYSKLYDQFYPLVFKIALNIVRNKELAEDLSVEIMTKVFKKLEKYEKDISFELWIKKVANNHIIDYIRKIPKETNIISLDDEFYQGLNPTDGSNPEKDIIKNEVRKIFENEMDLLSPRARQILHLRYGHDFSYQQIAETLGISIGTVKSLLNKNKQKITKKIKSDERNLSKVVTGRKNSTGL